MSHRSRKYSRRKRSSPLVPIVLALGGVLVLALAYAAWRERKPASTAAPEVTGGPSLKADRETVDLGDVKLDNVVSVEFQLSNVGDKALNFTEEPYIEVVEGC